MLKSEVKTGRVYLALVSGTLCRVKILGERTVDGIPPGLYRPGRASKTVWDALNLETNHSVVIKSAQRLRREVQDTPFRAWKVWYTSRVVEGNRSVTLRAHTQEQAVDMFRASFDCPIISVEEVMV